MNTSILPEALLAVFVGNFVTAWAVYLMWRIKKDERDWLAISGMLFICLIVVVTAVAVRSPT